VHAALSDIVHVLPRSHGVFAARHITQDYKIKCLDTATQVAPAAKAAGVEKWVEVSTAQIYESSSKVPLWCCFSEAPVLILLVLAETVHGGRQAEAVDCSGHLPPGG
jgi:hypothetical protein